MRKYGLEFCFLSPSRLNLGVNYLQGIIHEEDGDKNYIEITLGFLFFYIEITVRERQ
jgi:hypothetical protein